MISIYSWNVNGIRAIERKGLWKPFLEKEKPDIICLQETKANKEQIDLHLEGYDSYWFSAQRPGYSGTAIITKMSPLKVVHGFPESILEKHKLAHDGYGHPDEEGRVIAAEFDDFWLVSVYTPNAKDDLSRIPLREKQWDPAFLDYCKSLEKEKPVVFCGDLNVAHTEEDLARPKPNVGKKGFTNEERAGFQAFVDNGFIDTFRIFTKGNGHYTWWSHFAKARERNVGWRIDYFLVSNSIKSKVKKASIHKDILGSDHCPVSIMLDL